MANRRLVGFFGHKVQSGHSFNVGRPCERNCLALDTVQVAKLDKAAGHPRKRPARLSITHNFSSDHGPPNAMAVRRDSPRYVTVLPGEGSLAGARWPPSLAIYDRRRDRRAPPHRIDVWDLRF
jgi:hypothetical protein